MIENEEFRCKICGGSLEIVDENLGICKCINCGNKAKVKLSDIVNFAPITPPSPSPVLVNVTNEDIKHAESLRKRKNLIYSIKGIIALYSIAIISLYLTIMGMYTKGDIDVGTMEVILISIVGLFVPMVFSVFAKVYKNKKESIYLNIFVLLLTTAAFCAILFVGISKFIV